MARATRAKAIVVKGQTYYTVAEAADLLQVSEGMVRRMIAQGEIAHIRLGVYRIPKSEIDRLLTPQLAAPARPAQQELSQQNRQALAEL